MAKNKISGFFHLKIFRIKVCLTFIITGLEVIDIDKKLVTNYVW